MDSSQLVRQYLLVPAVQLVGRLHLALATKANLNPEVRVMDAQDPNGDLTQAARTASHIITTMTDSEGRCENPSRRLVIHRASILAATYSGAVLAAEDEKGSALSLVRTRRKLFYDAIQGAEDLPKRAGLTRFVKNRQPEPCSSVVVVLKVTDGEAGAMVLLTAFIGTKAEPEPWDRNLRGGVDKRKRVVAYFVLDPTNLKLHLFITRLLIPLFALSDSVVFLRRDACSVRRFPWGFSQSSIFLNGFGSHYSFLTIHGHRVFQKIFANSKGIHNRNPLAGLSAQSMTCTIGRAPL